MQEGIFFKARYFFDYFSQMKMTKTFLLYVFFVCLIILCNANDHTMYIKKVKDIIDFISYIKLFFISLYVNSFILFLFFQEKGWVEKRGKNKHISDVQNSHFCFIIKNIKSSKLLLTTIRAK